MSPRDLLRGAFAALAGHRLRALLTLLGVMIGTGSVVALAGLLRGAEEALLELNQGVSESDTLRISREEVSPRDRGRTTRPLSAGDGEALADAPRLAGVDVTVESRREARASYGGKDKRVRLMGVGDEAMDMYRLSVAQGRALDGEDRRRGARVVVIGHEVFTELFRDAAAPTPTSALGAQLRIDGEGWTVVGVLAHKPVMGHGDGTWMWDRRVLAPRSSFEATFRPRREVDAVFLRARSPTEAWMQAISGIADGILLRRHAGVRNFSADDRTGGNKERSILMIIQVLLLGTGLMSLFVGGINIMNIMLVTVSERTREIGVRRAVGATPRAILGQFVLEAGAVSLLGGVLGVLGGLAVSGLASLALSSAFGGWPFHVVPWSIVLGLLLALVTGVVFGWVPAWRASRMDPVEALRSVG